MIHYLLETPDIQATLSTSDGIKEAQLLKLAINSLVNPLTVIFRCKMGQLFDQPPRLELMKALLREAGQIIRATQPQASEKPENGAFTDEKLLALVLKATDRVKDSKSSTLQDTEAGRKTEIDYLNGYFVSQAKQLGIPCDNNNIIVEMVKQRQEIENKDIWSCFKMGNTVSTLHAQFNGEGRDKTARQRGT